MSTKSLLAIVLLPLVILLIPAGAMLFEVDGWAWETGSFVIAWVLMFGVGLAYLLVTKTSASPAYRLATAMALAAGFLLLWINGAVGLIGSEDNPANLMYGGVLAVGVVGTAIARLSPEGMARVMLATALAQLMVPAVALVFWRSDFSPGIAPVFGLNLVFVLLFAGSALLFHQAGSTQSKPVGGAVG